MSAPENDPGIVVVDDRFVVTWPSGRRPVRVAADTIDAWAAQINIALDERDAARAEVERLRALVVDALDVDDCDGAEIARIRREAGLS